MSIRESFELRGERRGKIKVLLKMGKTDKEIIQYLTTEDDSPLTEEQAEEVLESYHEEN